jgi:hypothetical protein
MRQHAKRSGDYIVIPKFRYFLFTIEGQATTSGPANNRYFFQERP